MSETGSTQTIAEHESHAAPEWRVDDAPRDYPAAVQEMDERAAAIRAGQARELIWLTGHPPLYTAGSSADVAELLEPDKFPVYKTGRGGKHTYHGPGQRIGYVLMDLKARKADVRAYVCALEDWIIQTLAAFAIKGERRDGRIGVWVDMGGGREAKIAAIGVRVRRWVTLHGMSLNVEPDLSHYGGIVPCGISDFGVTSMAELGQFPTMPEVDVALRRTFPLAFREFGFDEETF